MKEELQTVALYMNTKLHKWARMPRGSFNAAPESIASLNLRDAWDNTDPELFTFLSLMTQPVRYTKRNLFESVPTPTELNTKSVRLFYALGVLLFCTNNTCSAVTTKNFSYTSNLNDSVSSSDFMPINLLIRPDSSALMSTYPLLTGPSCWHV